MQRAHDELCENNFFIWNCYFSSQFSKEQIDRLNETLISLSPYRRPIEKLSHQDRQLIIDVFREGRGQGLQLPEPHLKVSFSGTEFTASFNMGGCIVPGQLDANGSVFRHTASFPSYIEPFAWPFRLVWAVLGERFFAGNDV